jgi:hypothetical protein
LPIGKGRPAVRESTGRRWAFAFFFALAGGALVALGNPMDHVKADLRADAQGLKLSLEIAADAIESCARRV